MATRLREQYVTEVAKLNNRLFDEEQNLERLERAVSAARYYLAAEPTNPQSVYNLYGATHNRNAQRECVERMRQQLQQKIDEVFANIEGSEE